jgi:hypothetical protein
MMQGANGGSRDGEGAEATGMGAGRQEPLGAVAGQARRLRLDASVRKGHARSDRSALSVSASSPTGPHSPAAKQTARDVVDAAGRVWDGAVTAHDLAPPDAGFAVRLRALATAADAQAAAYHQAADAGMAWTGIADADRAQPPYELRPDTGRRGPPELWQRFDRAVERLNRASASTSLSRLASAYAELAAAAHALADRVDADDPPAAWPAPAQDDE